MKTISVGLVILLIGSSFLIKEIHEDTVEEYHEEYRKIEIQYIEKELNSYSMCR